MSDPNLSISSIAGHVRLSPGYLSRFFKEQAGEGLLDYINRLRLARAKLMLVDEARSIGEIAKTVGYSDSNAFIRVFKRYEGITPGKYRQTKPENGHHAQG